jgi:hypothetical protein
MAEKSYPKKLKCELYNDSMLKPDELPTSPTIGEQMTLANI